MAIEMHIATENIPSMLSQPNMPALKASFLPSPHIPQTQLKTHLPFCSIPTSFLPSVQRSTLSRSKLYTTLSTSSTVSTEPELQTDTKGEKFDWHSQWYPVMPICELDKRVPHAKKVVGLDVVVWWDRNEECWKVFDDACSHRLAPLSEGRIDQWGRLQCVYHGWCFDGCGDCKFIPQALPDGPPVHTFKKACVAAYPSTVQHEILWFWPNTSPEYKHILSVKKPPYIPELDDPSFSKLINNREMPYGYEILIENLMDPAHVPYAHYKILPNPLINREGGTPIDIDIQKLDIKGFQASRNGGLGTSKFMAPCVYYSSFILPSKQVNQTDKGNGTANNKVLQRKALLVFMCVPVSPGRSRLIFTFPRNFGTWIDQVIPRWMFHLNQNLVLDSDMYLLHVKEHKIMEIGPSNWQKACFVPTKSDAHVVAFRKWLKKYSSDAQFDWGDKFNGGELPPTPPKEQLMDRYRSHVLNCSSCRAAQKGLNALELVLRIISFVSIGIVAATKQAKKSTAMRTSLVLLCSFKMAGSLHLQEFPFS